MSNAVRNAIAVAFILATTGGCATAQEGYTCCNLHHDQGRISDANWRHLPMIPAGAKVRILDSSWNRANVEIDGKSAVIAQDYGRDQEAFDRYLSKLIVQEDPRARIATYSPEVRQAIFDGVVIRGMTREQVLTAVGYPPTHRTFTLEATVWHFWATKLGRYEVYFNSDGTVEQVIGDVPRLVR